MKPNVTSVETLYNSQVPTGEVVLDEIVRCLRTTRFIAVSDLAALMDVKEYELRMTVRMLTGISPRELITRWRLLQARDLLRSKAFDSLKPRSARLTAVARRCGWRSYRVMLKVAQRCRFELEKEL